MSLKGVGGTLKMNYIKVFVKRVAHDDKSSPKSAVSLSSTKRFPVFMLIVLVFMA